MDPTRGVRHSTDPEGPFSTRKRAFFLPKGCNPPLHATVGCTRHCGGMTDPITEIQAKLDERDKAYEHAHAVSAELWDLVAESGMSISEIARRLGLSRTAVQAWSRRRKK